MSVEARSQDCGVERARIVTVRSLFFSLSMVIGDTQLRVTAGRLATMGLWRSMPSGRTSTKNG